MSEWKETVLTEITSKIGDGLHGTPKYDVNGDYFFVNGNNLSDGEIIIKPDTKRVSEKEFIKHKKPLTDKTILLSINGTIGNVALFKGEKCMLGKSACYININDFADRNFMYYEFRNRNFQTYIQECATGTTIPNVPLKGIREYRFKLPPLNEQKAIADILSGFDEKINLLHRQNTTLEMMAQVIFKQLFFEEAENNWETKKLEDILTISSSKRIFYKEYVSSGIPFYRSKEIIELSNGGNTSTELFITEERFNEIDLKFGSPRKGDILLTSVGTLGVSYRVRENDKFYFKDGNLTWFSEFNLLPSSIIYCWLNSSVGKEELDNISIGSTQAALTISGLRQIELKIPPQNIINQLNDDLESIYQKLEFNQKQIRTLEKMRDSLLPKLLNNTIKLSV